MKGINESKRKIFISSAQRKEGIIDWAEIRRKIKTYLEGKGLFNVFIIEDSCAGISSEEYMLMQVRNSDVVVIIIGNELRKGTRKEYEEAIRFQKKLFIYFLNLDKEQQSEDVKNLRKEIHTNDYALTGKIDDIKKIGEQIYVDLETYVWTTTLDSAIKDKERMYDVKKNDLKLYSKAYENLKCELLGNKDSVIDINDCYQSFAKTMQKFLLTGELNIQLKDEIKILENVYKNNQILYNRFRAFMQYINDNKEKSLCILNEVLSNGQQDRMAAWIRSNILIDCRNLKDELNKKNGLFMGKNEYQEVIDNDSSMIFFPADDRYLNNIYENIRKEELKKKSESPMSFSFGSGFNECLDLFQDYYFTAVLYGSITHILKSREILINILYKYSMIYNSDEYVFTIFKLLVLNGNVKDIMHYNTILSNKFQIDLAKLSKELWNISNNTCINKKMTKISIIKTYAMYFDDSTIHEIIDYIFDIVPENYLYLSDYLKCISSMIQRIPQEKVINLIIKLLDKKLIEGKEMSNILLRLNIKDIEESILISLKESLMKNVDEIIERGGSPQYIVNLLYQNKDIFDDVVNKVYAKMTEEDKHYFAINMNNDNKNSSYVDLLNDDIKYINSIIKQGKNGVFNSQLYDSVNSINDIVLVDNLVIDKTKLQSIYYLLTYLIKIKNDVGLAEIVIDCFISIVTKCKQMNFNCDFINIDKDINLMHLNDMMWSLGTINSVDIKVFCLRCLLGQVLKNDINDIYYNYLSYTNYERGVLSNSVFKIIPYIHMYLKEFINLIYIMSSDDYFYVRYNALECLPYIQKIIEHGRGEKLIDKFINDENRNVRITLLNMCKTNKFAGEIKKHIVEELSKDIDYEIRSNAN